MNDKILQMLGLASRAQALSFGFKQSIDSVKSGKTKLVLTASDISPKTAKEVAYFCGRAGAEHIRTDFTIAQISAAVGKNAGVISVNAESFAARLLQLCENNEEE